MLEEKVEDNLVGVVILYNPSEKNLDAILHNSKILDYLIIIDNSDNNLSHTDVLNCRDNIRLITLKKNLGIGRALNIGAEVASELSVKWLTTIDQDSELPLNYREVLDFTVLAGRNIGVVSPVHLRDGEIIERVDFKESDHTTVESVMMSGNIINMQAFREVGGFNEEFFMDYVDIEYCLRLKNLGYDIILLKNIGINHSLGDSEWYRLGRLILKPTNHSPLRRYYITRNRLSMIFNGNYGIHYKLNDIARFFKELIYIVAFEKHKFKKFKAIFLGIRDMRRKKLGKLDANL
jgi:rhamnosyltransferase